MVTQYHFITQWIGAYSFCAANDLALLTFDSQDEHDKIISYLRSNVAYINSVAGPIFNIFVETFTMVAGNGAAFRWYTTGVPFNKNLVIDWNPGEPNNAFGSEFCMTLLQRPGDLRIGMNDFPCLYLQPGFSNTVVCQQKTVLPVSGYRNKY